MGFFDGAALAKTWCTVDCWIGVVVEDDRLVIRLEGRLSVAQVPELLKTWADTEPAELDLAELLSADVGGIEALRRCDAGTALVRGAWPHQDED